VTITGGILSVGNSFAYGGLCSIGWCAHWWGWADGVGNFIQRGGTVDLGGAVAITQAAGDLVVGASAANITLNAPAGSVNQNAALTTPGLLTVPSSSATTLTDAGNRIAAIRVNSAGPIRLANGVDRSIQGLLAVTAAWLWTTSAVSARRHGGGACWRLALTADGPLSIGPNGVTALGDVNL
jgi:hypothetical protein